MQTTAVQTKKHAQRGKATAVCASTHNTTQTNITMTYLTQSKKAEAKNYKGRTTHTQPAKKTEKTTKPHSERTWWCSSCDKILSSSELKRCK